MGRPDFEIVATSQLDSQTIMAFDFGYKRIGTAIGETLMATARELKPVSNARNGPAWHAIEELIKDWQPDAFLVGLPLPADGNENSPMVRSARAFGAEIGSRFDRPVHYIDEHLSSHAADQHIRDGVEPGKRITGRKIASRDSVAARLILESWFANNATPCD